MHIRDKYKLQNFLLNKYLLKLTAEISIRKFFDRFRYILDNASIAYIFIVQNYL